MTALLWGSIAALGVAGLLILTQHWHLPWTNDASDRIQRLHRGAVPRVGGIALFLGTVAGCLQAPGPVAALLLPLLMAGSLAFLVGLIEDLTQRVGVRLRLIATMLSGLAAALLTGVSLTHVDVWGLDLALAWLPCSLLFTMFAIGGVANALNIVDGCHGLLGLTAMGAALGLAGVAHSVGDSALVHACLILCAAQFGVFVLNWPLGRIFMGDGGAYFVGFALAWLAVLLVERNAEVSPFVDLLICVHPITEVMFSVWRRLMRKQHPGQADHQHFHSLIYRRYLRRALSHYPHCVPNALTGLLVGSLSLIAAGVAPWVATSTAAALLATVLYVLFYLAIYARMVRGHWCSPITFITCRPVREVNEVGRL